MYVELFNGECCLPLRSMCKRQEGVAGMGRLHKQYSTKKNVCYTTIIVKNYADDTSLSRRRLLFRDFFCFNVKMICIWIFYMYFTVKMICIWSFFTSLYCEDDMHVTGSNVVMFVVIVQRDLEMLS